MSPFLLAPLAVTAGVFSFTSPCVLPLLPGYLAYMTGLPDEGAQAGRREVRVRAAVFFVAGFTTVFTILGVSVALAGASVARHVPLMTRASGVVLVVAGLLTAHLVRAPSFLLREGRPGLVRTGRLPGGAFILGCAFAAGWSPCIGPVLASILTLTAGAHTAWSGGALLLLYSLGLGVPFVMVAAGAGRPRWLPWMRRHAAALERTGGLLLAGVGLLLLAGAWEQLLQPLQRAMAGLDWPPV